MSYQSYIWKPPDLIITQHDGYQLYRLMIPEMGIALGFEGVITVAIKEQLRHLCRFPDFARTKARVTKREQSDQARNRRGGRGIGRGRGGEGRRGEGARCSWDGRTGAIQEKERMRHSESDAVRAAERRDAGQGEKAVQQARCGEAAWRDAGEGADAVRVRPCGWIRARIIL